MLNAVPTEVRGAGLQHAGGCQGRRVCREHRAQAQPRQAGVDVPAPSGLRGPRPKLHPHRVLRRHVVDVHARAQAVPARVRSNAVCTRTGPVLDGNCFNWFDSPHRRSSLMRSSLPRVSTSTIRSSGEPAKPSTAVWRRAVLMTNMLFSAEDYAYLEPCKA